MPATDLPLGYSPSNTPANCDLDAMGLTVSTASANAAASVANANAALVNAATAQATATAAQIQAAAAVATANAAFASGGGNIVPIPALGRTVTSLQSWVNGVPTLSAKDYGILGDGTNEQVKFQAALTAAEAANLVLDCGALEIRIDTNVICAGPGVVFDAVPHGATGGPGIYVGANMGTPAVTIQGNPNHILFTLHGQGKTADGVLFDNPQQALVGHVRVYDLVGYGIRIEKCWDCVFLHLSTEKCGTATKYAFSMNGAGDTCNMTHVVKLQAEVSNELAIFVDGSSLSCIIDNIHSERNIPPGALPGAGAPAMWHLGGARCTYNGARLNSAAPSQFALCRLESDTNTYLSLATEDSVVLEADAVSGTNLTLIAPKLSGSYLNKLNTYGCVTILGGEITTLASDFISQAAKPQTVLSVRGTRIGTLTIKDVTAGVGSYHTRALLATFTDCTISVLSGANATSSATFFNCFIESFPATMQGDNVFNNCALFTAAPLQHWTLGSTLVLAGTVVNQAITYKNHAAIRMRSGARVDGTITMADAGTGDVIVDATSVVSTLSADINAAPTGGAHNVGETHWRPTPVVGQPIGWRCTVAASPGTWVAMANL